jgi:hypothetical protein
VTWSYSGDPGGSESDQVRFLIGDTVTADQQLTNEEIAWLILNEGSPVRAAIKGAESLSAKYARQVDKTVGNLSLSASQRSKRYAELAKQLTDQYITRGTSLPWAGAISRDDKNERQLDGDRTDPFFEREMMPYRNDTTYSNSMRERRGEV